MCEVPVGGEYLPPVLHRHSSHQHIHRTGGNSNTSAQIARPGCFLLVTFIDRDVGEVSKVFADSAELRLFPNTG